MKIYTKKGDQGQTSLIGGERVSKAFSQIEAYGTVDELNSYLGLVGDHLVATEVSGQIRIIQNNLFVLGSLLATSSQGTSMKLPEIHEADVQQLESWIDQFETELPPLTHFILPGGHPANSHCHVARCICRRAERRCVELHDLKQDVTIAIKYLNRLSDYLFVLARYVSQWFEIEEIKWIPKV